jgi:hypothetical protein
MSSGQALIPRAAEALADIEKQVGGRAAIIQALITAPPSKDVQYVLGLLADPANEKRTLAQLCVEAKITPGQLLDLLERGTRLRARIISGQIIARSTPAVVTDVMAKAAPFEDTCPDCAGTGTHTPEPSQSEQNPNPVQCKTCRGGGTLRYEADPECRKLALEMAGLTAKGGGINIAVQANVAAPGAGGAGMAYEALTELMDRMLYSRKTLVAAPTTEPAIDAELIRDTPESPLASEE